MIFAVYITHLHLHHVNKAGRVVVVAAIVAAVVATGGGGCLDVVVAVVVVAGGMSQGSESINTDMRRLGHN